MSSDTQHEAAIEAAISAAKQSLSVHDLARDGIQGTWKVFRGFVPRTDPMDAASRAFEGGWFARAAYDAARSGEREDRHDQLDAAKAEVSRRAPRGVVFSDAQAEWIALGALAAARAARSGEREEADDDVIKRAYALAKPWEQHDWSSFNIYAAGWRAARSGEVEGDPSDLRTAAEDVLKVWDRGNDAPVLESGLIDPVERLRAALSQHPEPRQDQPVDRASGEPTPMRECCGATFKCRYSNAEYVQPCDRCPYSDVGPVEHPKMGEREQWEVYDEKRHGSLVGAVFECFGPRVPTGPLVLAEHPETGEGEARARYERCVKAEKHVTWPEWDELDEATKNGWRDRAPEPLQDGGEREAIEVASRARFEALRARRGGAKSYDEFVSAAGKAEEAKAMAAAIAAYEAELYPPKAGDSPKDQLEETQTLDEIARYMAKERSAQLQDGGEREALAVAQAALERVADYRHNFSSTLEGTGPILDAIEVYVRNCLAESKRLASLARHPHQDVERRVEGALEQIADLAETTWADERAARRNIAAVARAALGPSPDDPTQLGSEQSAPNTTAEKLGPASPDDRGGER